MPFGLSRKKQAKPTTLKFESGVAEGLGSMHCSSKQSKTRAAAPSKSALGFKPTTDAELDALSSALDKTLSTATPFTPPSSPMGDDATPATIDAEYSRRVVILDWDDTLLATTRLTSRYSVFASRALPSSLVKQLDPLQDDAIKLLKLCSSFGKTVIVTNAAQGWVQQSGRRFVPKIIQYLEQSKTEIISAQTKYAHFCPTDPGVWKKKAFTTLLATRGMNLISIGDSIFEREAAHYASRQCRTACTKTIKFIDSPTVAQLRMQISKLAERLPSILGHEGSVDVDIEC